MTKARINDGPEFDTDDKEAFEREVKKGLTDMLGHNRTRPGGIAADQLRSIVERIEKLEEEKAEIAADIREVFAEAKGNGFDVKALRTILKLRKMDASERDEQEAVVDTYKRALGMQLSLDLGDGKDAA